MILPDVNLLIYAYNAADPNHLPARRWWESCLNGHSPVGMTWFTISGFIRLMTHPRVLENPMPISRAVHHSRSWIEKPNVLVLEPGRRFGNVFLGLLEQIGTAGNLTSDAYLAALAIEHQAELQSCDHDFSRFHGLNWKNPL